MTNAQPSKHQQPRHWLFSPLIRVSVLAFHAEERVFQSRAPPHELRQLQHQRSGYWLANVDDVSLYSCSVYSSAARCGRRSGRACRQAGGDGRAVWPRARHWCGLACIVRVCAQAIRADTAQQVRAGGVASSSAALLRDVDLEAGIVGYKCSLVSAVLMIRCAASRRADHLELTAFSAISPTAPPPDEDDDTGERSQLLLTRGRRRWNAGTFDGAQIRRKHCPL